MKNSFLMKVISFLPVTRLNLFAQGNSLGGQSPAGPPQMGQPQMGPPQGGGPLSQGLEAYSLPKGAITENDLPRIKTAMQQVLEKINESLKSAGQAKNRSDLKPIKSGILAFQDWLKRQGCINQASTTYDIEAIDKYSENIFVPYPGQLPFDVVFKMGGEMKKPYRLLIFVTTVDLFSFASLVENKSIGGVPALKNWPSSYMEKRPEI
jgi:hypothetical protein